MFLLSVILFRVLMPVSGDCSDYMAPTGTAAVTYSDSSVTNHPQSVTVSFTCQEGYSLLGSSPASTCGAGDVWSSSSTTCDPIPMYINMEFLRALAREGSRNQKYAVDWSQVGLSKKSMGIAMGVSVGAIGIGMSVLMFFITKKLTKVEPIDENGIGYASYGY